MSITPRRAIIPVYLFLCLIAGGSVQSVWANLALQLLAIAIIGWALVGHRRSSDWTPAGRQLLVLILAAATLIAVQLIPLPAGLWSGLPGRAPIAEGYQILGYPLPSLPISLARTRPSRPCLRRCRSSPSSRARCTSGSAKAWSMPPCCRRPLQR